MATPQDVQAAIKRRQVRRRKTAEETNDKEWKPIPKVTLETNDPFKTVYTKEENFRAYKLFSIMDVDNGGSISLRELNRILLGDTDRTFTANFEHPDTGISWTLDVDNYIIIDSKEPNSPSHILPYLIKGLRLVRVNDFICGNSKGNLHALLEYYIQLHDVPVELEFLEPAIILNQFSYMLDIKVESLSFAVELPMGAIYNLKAFLVVIKERLVQAHGSFKFMKVGLIQKSKQIYFKSNKFAFRLMFATGPNVNKSCRFALGFTAEDYPSSNYIIAQPMAIDLDLGISRHELEVLMQELFNIYDTDGSGEFEFEEFRDFYIKFLDTEESIAKLREYAHYRFRDLELEQWWYQKREQRERQRARREITNRLAGPIREEQRKKFYANSEVGKDGIRRRVYAERPKSKMMIKGSKRGPTKKALELPLLEQGGEDTSKGEEVGKDAVDVDHIDVVDTLELSDIDAEKQLKREKKMEEKEMKRRERDRQIRYEQRLRRMNKYNTAMQAKKVNEKTDRKRARAVDENLIKENMVEVQDAIRRGVQNTMQMTHGAHGHFNLNIDLSSIITTPALKLNSSLFGSKIKVQDIELEQLPPSKLHPATLRYFMIKDTTKAPDFDSSVRHPAFFSSEYFRKNTRHSSIALENARMITHLWNDGVAYRHLYGIKRNTVISPDDIPPSKPRVQFNLPEKSSDAIGTSTNGSKPTNAAANILLARATIISITLLDINIHATILNPNSPFVTVSCDDFKNSTEINVLGGGYYEWDELQWILRIYSQSNFTATVYSGTAQNHKAIGRFMIMGADIVKHPIDSQGNLELFGELTHNGTPAGNIKIVFYMELGEEWDWFVSDYWKKENAKKEHAKLMKFFSGKPKYYPPAIVFPLKITIVSITVYELRSVHMFLKNSPRVFVECGSWQQTSTVKHNAAIQAKWDGLDWLFGIVSERANLIFIVTSGDATIGRFAISGKELSVTPFTPLGDMDIRGVLTYNGDNEGGKINIQLRIQFPTASENVEGEDNDNNHEILDQLQINQTIDINDNESKNEVIDEAASIITKETKSTMPAIVPPNPRDIFPIKTFSSTNNSIRSLLPARLRFAHIGIYNLPNAHTISKNLPYLKIQCGRKEINTAVFNNPAGKGIHAEWVNIPPEFPITERMNLTVHVISRGKVIGSYSVTILDIMNHYAQSISSSSNEFVEIVDYISNNGAILENGLIKMKLFIDSHGKHDYIKYLLDQDAKTTVNDDKDLPQPLISGYAEMSASAISSPNKKGNRVYETSPFKYSYLPEMPYGNRPTTFPFRMNVISITATDLRSVHLLQSNSPHINVACGTWAMKTSVSLATGAFAQYLSLDWGFFVHEGNNVHFTAWSGDQLIGSCFVPALSILNCPVDNLGVSELFLGLTIERKATENGKSGKKISSGKLQVKYTLESKDKKDVEEPSNRKSISTTTVTTTPATTANDGLKNNSYTPLTIHLEPPILVTVYTIAVMDLISGHRFSKNSPMVKASCSKFLRNTSIIEHGGESGKWENLLWSIYMNDKMKLKVNVMTGSVVLGNIMISAYDLIRKPIDKYGLTEYEGYLMSGKEDHGNGHKGRIRIVCRLESHYQEDDDNDTHDTNNTKPKQANKAQDSDDDDDENNDEDFDFEIPIPLDKLIKLPPGKKSEKVKIPSISKVTIIGIAVSNLQAVHMITLNSPYLRIECGDTIYNTNAQFLAGSSAQWLHLSNWIFSLKRHSHFRVTVASGNKFIGAVAISTKEIYHILKDDLGHRLLTKEITSEGNETGILKIKLAIESENYHSIHRNQLLTEDEVDEEGYEISDLWKKTVAKTMPKEYIGSYLANEILKFPFSVTFYRMTVMDVSLFNGVASLVNNTSLSIRIEYGEVFKKTTDAIVNTGRYAQWDDCQNWSFVVNNNTSNSSSGNAEALKVFILSNNQIIGVFVITIQKLMSLPRNKNSQIDIIGNFTRFFSSSSSLENLPSSYLLSSATVGRVHLLVRLMNYIPPENKIRQLEDRNQRLQEILQGPSIIGYITINKIMVWELIQVYGLFKNSPRVIVNVGNWVNETSIAMDAGEQAAWPNLRWVNIPLLENSTFHVKVYSGNEMLGSVSVSCNDVLYRIPRREQDRSFAIASGLYDGNLLKGNVCIFACDQMDFVERPDLYDEIMDMGSIKSEYFIQPENSLHELGSASMLSESQNSMAESNNNYQLEAIAEEDEGSSQRGKSIQSHSMLSKSSYSVFTQEDIHELHRVIDFGISSSRLNETSYNTSFSSFNPHVHPSGNSFNPHSRSLDSLLRLV